VGRVFESEYVRFECECVAFECGWRVWQCRGLSFLQTTSLRKPEQPRRVDAPSYEGHVMRHPILALFKLEISNMIERQLTQSSRHFKTFRDHTDIQGVYPDRVSEQYLGGLEVIWKIDAKIIHRTGPRDRTHPIVLHVGSEHPCLESSPSSWGSSSWGPSSQTWSFLV